MHDVLPHDRPYAVTLRAQLDCPPAWTAPVTAALAAAGVEVDPEAAVGVGVGPGRTVSATVDDWTVASLPHLLVAVTSYAVEVGPWAAPGLGPCARCVAASVLDEGDAARLPCCRGRWWRSLPGRWPATSRPGRGGGAPHVAHLVALRPRAAARRPTLVAAPLLRVRLVRHRLSDRATTAHHHSLSSLPSIARRCVREQVSQKTRRRPFSTAVVHVRVSASGACVPQNAHVTVSLTRARLLRKALERPRAGTSSR